eukprot:UN1650
MPRLRIVPNVFSCNAAVSACAKGGSWQMSLHLFRSMVDAGLTSDMVTYCAVLDAVFDHHVSWELFNEGVGRGFFPQLLAAKTGIIDVHGMSPGAALMAVCYKLAHLMSQRAAGLAEDPSLLVITGWGKSHRSRTRAKRAAFTIKEAVRELLQILDLPLTRQDNPGRLLTTIEGVDTLP